MTTKEDLEARVGEIAREIWTSTTGRAVPDVRALPFGNSGKTFDACFLYADLSDSTALVNRVSATLAAEYYKAFLHCASKLIQTHGGTIEAYDGDRVMGIFLGDNKEELALDTAFKLRTVMRDIVNPTFARIYQDHQPLLYTVGIDSGSVLACKAGVRGDSELVWIGAAANYAAKLNSFPGLDHGFHVRITERVLLKLPARLTQFISGDSAWQGPKTVIGVNHYRSSGWMELD